MRIRIEEREYGGTGAEIMEQLWLEHEPDGISDVEGYIRYVCTNFTRTTGLAVTLPEGGVEEQALAVIRCLAEAGAVLLLDGD